MDDGTLVSVNTHLCELLGYTRTELLGWHVQKLFPPGGRIFHQTHVFPLLKMQARVEEIYMPLQTKQGRTVPALMNAVRRQEEDSAISECVFVRVSQRSEFEEQLIAARRIAERANAAKAKFLSMMSHDLRTPLTAISGYTRLLASGVHGALTPEQSDVTARIASAATDVTRLIGDILSFAQIDSGRVTIEMRPVSVAAAFARAEALVRMRVQDSGLSLDVASRDVDVLADGDRLQQVLLNLLTNAIKFTPRGGSVFLSCDVAGDRARLSVRDTGSGIEAEQLGEIFEPFVQVNPGGIAAADRGVGLGLAIARELVVAMNGSLSAASVPGEGSTFTVELSVAPAR